MKVWFIRHAQSLANASSSFKADDFSVPLVSLSPKGFKQAEELINSFSEAPELIITSSYVRTKQTAEPLIKKYPNVPQLEWPIQEFTYLSKGRCFGTTILERRPWTEEYWQKSNHLHLDGDGAERFVDFISRAKDTIENLKNRKEDFVVLFSHEYFITAVKYLLEKKPNDITSEKMREFRKYFLSNRVPNTSKIKFDFN
ncbi:MAG: phosphoglycerate mutase family protein [Candidatus Nealsonbacteria bacterium]|nr:phosphoglycerate mutase family protein [Candidatus Nealsonbacteria bacterium]